MGPKQGAGGPMRGSPSDHDDGVDTAHSLTGLPACGHPTPGAPGPLRSGHRATVLVLRPSQTECGGQKEAVTFGE